MIIINKRCLRGCACESWQTSLFPFLEPEIRVELEFPLRVRLGISLGDVPSGQVGSHGADDFNALVAGIGSFNFSLVYRQFTIWPFGHLHKPPARASALYGNKQQSGT